MSQPTSTDTLRLPLDLGPSLAERVLRLDEVAVLPAQRRPRLAC